MVFLESNYEESETAKIIRDWNRQANAFMVNMVDTSIIMSTQSLTSAIQIIGQQILTHLGQVDDSDVLKQKIKIGLTIIQEKLEIAKSRQIEIHSRITNLKNSLQILDRNAIVQRIHDLYPLSQALDESLEAPSDHGAEKIPESKLVTEDFKAERTAQWGNTNGVPRGWDCYRVTTFFEICRAKIDRCIQAHNIIQKLEHERTKQESVLGFFKDDSEREGLVERLETLNGEWVETLEKIKAAKFDLDDSIKDMTNYWQKMLTESQKDEKFLTEPGMR